MGDDLYGHPSAYIGRQALHAYTLSFPHPSTQKQVSFFAPLPDDLSRLIANLFPSVTIPDDFEGGIYEKEPFV